MQNVFIKQGFNQFGVGPAPKYFAERKYWCVARRGLKSLNKRDVAVYLQITCEVESHIGVYLPLAPVLGTLRPKVPNPLL